MIKKQIIRYFAAMNASAFDATVHSCATFAGVATAHALADSIPALNLQQFGAALLFLFGREILKYLDAHPIAPLIVAAENAGGAK